MTDVELEKKANLYADDHFADKYEDGNWLSDEDMMSRAYIAGAKELEKENMQLKERIEKMKRCKICGAVFSPSYANQKYCSKNCARLGKNELQKNWVKKNIPKKEIKKVCTVCGAVFLLTRSARTICSKECVKKKKALIAKLYYQNNKTTLLKKSAEYRELQRSQRQGVKQTLIKKKDTLSLNFETKKEENA